MTSGRGALPPAVASDSAAPAGAATPSAPATPAAPAAEIPIHNTCRRSAMSPPPTVPATIAVRAGSSAVDQPDPGASGQWRHGEQPPTIAGRGLEGHLVPGVPTLPAVVVPGVLGERGHDGVQPG